MSILDYVPNKYTLRSVQKEVLLAIEANWNEYDVLSISAPVASGKSLVSITVSHWREAMGDSSAILTPLALLQDQYQEDYPAFPSLKGKARYSCKDKDMKSCNDYYTITENYCCGQCPYVKARTEVRESKKAILNFHSHLFGGLVHDEYKDNLIIDEAHKLVPILSDLYALRIWKHKEKDLNITDTKDDVIVWLERQIKDAGMAMGRLKGSYKDTKMPPNVKKVFMEHFRLHRKYKMIKEGLVGSHELFNIALTSQPYGRARQMQECIEVKPISLKTVPHKMWPDGKVKKVILLSATIYDKDIERLGLTRKRVKYINCGSPIPAENRPIIIKPIGSMSYKNVDSTIIPMSQAIKDLGNHHDGKGIVHITYALAKKFKQYLTDERFMWHTELTRESTYKKFRASKEPKILMACGMSEGIDLAGDDYQWQVIAKVIFPSLADPLQKHFINKEPIIYTLEVVRTLVQQSGRICRTPTDKGVTYILDSSFGPFYKRSTNGVPHYSLFPDYFVEAMKWI